MTVQGPADQPPPPNGTEGAAAGSSAAAGPPDVTSGSPAQPAAASPADVGRAIPRTRVSATYVGLICSLVVLVVLLVFILENTRRVPVTFFGATGHLPLGVALLLAAVAGAVILGVVATVRILQLRRRVRQAHR
jgi:uncharacterized integral membrane protein